jgi:hypothetical protein
MAVHMPNCLLREVPYGADQTVYLVFDSFGASRSDCPEKEIERDDLETIISDLLTGQFNAPVRVMAFNTLEHWIEDVSNQVAEDIQARCESTSLSATPSGSKPRYLPGFVIDPRPASGVPNACRSATGTKVNGLLKVKVGERVFNVGIDTGPAQAVAWRLLLLAAAHF